MSLANEFEWQERIVELEAESKVLLEENKQLRAELDKAWQAGYHLYGSEAAYERAKTVKAERDGYRQALEGIAALKKQLPTQYHKRNAAFHSAVKRAEQALEANTNPTA